MPLHPAIHTPWNASSTGGIVAGHGVDTTWPLPNPKVQYLRG